MHMSSWCPPLFDESPQRHTKRLFLYAADEIAELLRRKFRISGYVSADYEYMAHMAWLIGATAAAQALIREIDVVKSAWGKGEDDKALLLTNLCAAHMISVWIRDIDPRPGLTAEARSAELQNGASSLLGVINRFVAGGPSGTAARTAQDVKKAMEMDRQWRSEADGAGPRPAYTCLILCRALEACGQPCVEWGRLSFPIRSVQEFLDTGALLDAGLLGDPRRLLTVSGCLEQGVRSMKRYYELNMRGKMEPSGKP